MVSYFHYSIAEVYGERGVCMNVFILHVGTMSLDYMIQGALESVNARNDPCRQEYKLQLGYCFIFSFIILPMSKILTEVCHVNLLHLPSAFLFPELLGPGFLRAIWTIH